MATLWIAAVWLHILAAVAWLGSMVFLGAILVPVLRRQAEPALRTQLFAETGRRLRLLGWICFAALAGTGVAALAVRGFSWVDVGGRLWEGPFGRVLAIKLTLFAGVVALSAVHDFAIGPRAVRTADPQGAAQNERLRRLASWMGRLTLLLALGIVLCGVLLVRGVP